MPDGYTEEQARRALELVEKWAEESDALYAEAEQRLWAIVCGESTDYGHPNKPGRIARDALLTRYAETGEK